MSLFGVIMLFVTMGWTAFLLLVLSVVDIYAFLQGPGVITFTIGYVVIVVVFIIAKKVVQSM